MTNELKGTRLKKHQHQCKRCSHSRFKTLQKGVLYACRQCGLVKDMRVDK